MDPNGLIRVSKNKSTRISDIVNAMHEAVGVGFRLHLEVAAMTLASHPWALERDGPVGILPRKLSLASPSIFGNILRSLNITGFCQSHGADASRFPPVRTNLSDH